MASYPSCLRRERQTIECMAEIYCRRKHAYREPSSSGERHGCGGAAGLCCRLGRYSRSIPVGPAAAGHNRVMGLCCSCRDLLDYALQRIDKCPFQDDKPTCQVVLGQPIHCYKKDRRDQIRQVMAYAGPWMLLYHPVLR